MAIDAISCESHFLDHLAPVWRALSSKGRFLVDKRLLSRAENLGIAAQSIDANAIRSTDQQPARRDGTPCLVASIGDVKVGRRLGYGPFAFLEHGAGQAYETSNPAASSYAGGPDREDNELFLVPNEYSAGRWRRSYPSARVEVVGCPRLDDLPLREPGPRPVICTSFHWPASPFLSGFAGSAAAEYLPALADLTRRFTVIGHQHPNWINRAYPGPPSKTYERLGIEYVPEFADVCRRADLYIADNTSTLFEFAATGRPVVVLNTREWAAARPHGPGLRFWDAAHVGVNVDRPKDLIAGVEEALADSPERQRDREDALSFVYQPRTNGAAYAATAITDWLASREAVAA